MSLYGALAGSIPGKKVVHGRVLPTAGATVLEVGDQLESIDAVLVSLQGVDLTHMWTIAGFSGTTVTLVHRKPTSSGDVTPVAATTPWNTVHYVIIGDAPK